MSSKKKTMKWTAGRVLQAIVMTIAILAVVASMGYFVYLKLVEGLWA